MKLPKWLEEIEYLVDKIVPYMLIVLTFLIALEFTHFAEEYHSLIVWTDNFIIAFFIVDLLFKWNHVKNAVTFFRLYWIDVLAVFPFYLIFRLYAFAAEITLAGEQTQKVLHEAALIRETKLIGQSKIITQLVREGKFLRAGARFLRLLRIRWYIAHGHMHGASKQYSSYHKIKCRKTKV